MIRTPSIERHDWLERSAAALRRRFDTCGYTVPDNVRVSIGWPKGAHGSGRAIGQCWSPVVSSDKHAEIFISPELGEKVASVKIVGVLTHELVHATVGTEAGHKKPFKQCALAVGLEGKMTATSEGPDLVRWINGEIIKKIGHYPAGRIDYSARKKQTTRLIKCACEDCGYVARVTRKWIEDAGAPICPNDWAEMTCEELDDE